MSDAADDVTPEERAMVERDIGKCVGLAQSACRQMMEFADKEGISRVILCVELILEALSGMCAMSGDDPQFVVDQIMPIVRRRIADIAGDEDEDAAPAEGVH